MSDVFFQQLDIPQPDYHLSIGSGSHGSQTGKMLEAMSRQIVRLYYGRDLVRSLLGK